MVGKIKKLPVGEDGRSKGFGFVRDEGGKEYFFHRSAVVGARFDQLAEGQDVTFDEETSDRGLRATNVQLA